MGKEWRVSLSVIGVVLAVFCILLYLRLQRQDFQPPTMDIHPDMPSAQHRSAFPPPPPQPTIVRHSDWSPFSSALDNPAGNAERNGSSTAKPDSDNSAIDPPPSHPPTPTSLLPEPSASPRL